MIATGRSQVFRYEPDPAVVELLGYQRNDALTMFGEVATTARTATDTPS